MSNFLFFQFICDNYTKAAGPSNTSPTVSHSARAAGDVFLDDSSCVSSMHQELADLRQQLQAMKKQAITIMDQSHKSSDRERAAIRQAQEALELKESAVVDASRAIKRENYMLDLMIDAMHDMAGMLCCSFPLLSIFFTSLIRLCCFFCAACRFFP
jgi:hypothetical protein